MMKFINTIFITLLTIGMHASAATNRVFVTNEKSNDLTVIDATTLKVETTIAIGQRPRGIGLSPDGKKTLRCAKQ